MIAKPASAVSLHHRPNEGAILRPELHDEGSHMLAYQHVHEKHCTKADNPFKYPAMSPSDA